MNSSLLVPPVSMDGPLTQFARCLLEDGRIVSHGAVHLQRPSNEDLDAAGRVVRSAAVRIRQNLPRSCPEIDLRAAMTGVLTVAWASAVYLDRLIDSVEMPDWLMDRQPAIDHGGGMDMGIDVAGRLMADLRRRIAEAGPDDALLIPLDRWMSRWPLSCVGSPVVPEAADWNRVIRHAGLRRVMMDRIVLRRDESLMRRDDVASILKREGIE